MSLPGALLAEALLQDSVGILAPWQAQLPNPVRRIAAIDFALPQGGRVTLRILDVSGRVVRTLTDAPMAGGRYTLHWDGRSNQGWTVASGVYFAELRTATERAVKRLVLLR